MIFPEYGSKKESSVNAEIERAAKALKIDDDYGEVSAERTYLDKDAYGICHDCERLRCAETKYGNSHAYCYEFEKHLNKSDPVVKCSMYKKKGEMSLVEMGSMAYIIEADTKKKAGFI